MTPDTSGANDETMAHAGATLRRRIATRIRAMQGILFFERLWPRLLPALCVAALFVAFSWFGFFRLVPDWLRIAALIVFAGLFIGSFFTFRGLRWPLGPEALRRLETDNRIVHQALAAQSDRLEQGDAFARSLWRRHQARMAEKVAAIRLAAPRPPTPRLDPYGVRVFVALILVTAFGYSFSNQSGLIGDAFRSHVKQVEIAGIRVDAWVTPPEYTGKPPIFLTGNTTGLPDVITVPEGSEMLVRIVGGSGSEEVIFETSEVAIAMPPQEDPKATTAANRSPDARSFRHSPAGDGTLVVRQGQDIAERWQFALIPDDKPVIAFDGRPSRAVNGALEIAFIVDDDYGVQKAYAEIAPVTPQSPDANPLYGPPDYPLTLPRSAAGERKGRDSRNLTEHPLAGMPVKITLVAEDSIGQTGRSETIEMELPGRYFNNLLAGAVAEQRQVLALDTNRLDRVFDLNDAITFAPEDTIKNATHYLLIRSARTRLKQSYNDDMYRDSADYLWDIALGIEDGNLSFAERRLRDAQRALSEALENGASDETIQALMDELREAMQEFLQALAQNMQRNQETAQIPQSDLQNMLRSDDLNRMLDQIENLAQSGARDQAQQLLSELQRMMNNLQMGQQQQAQGDNPMRQQMDKLGELMQRQQQLMEETFDLEQALRERQRQQFFQDENSQQGENQQGPGQQMTEEQLRQALRDLQEQQQALQQQLGEMQEALEGMGMPQNEGFNEAGEAMGEAGEALGEGQGETAVGEQGRALQALRDGAQSMMNQMRQAMGQNPGGPNNGPGSRNPTRLDPLGRPRANTGPDFGDNVKIPEEADIQRARRILEAIRERLGDAFRPEMERFYLERLLDNR